MKVVEISEKEKHIKIFEAKNATQVIINIHGFTSSGESRLNVKISEELIKHGCTVVNFDLPRHGELKSSEPILYDECLREVEYVEKLVDERYNLPIVYVASSFGGYMLLNHIAKTNRIYKNVILRAPAVFMGEMMDAFLLRKYCVKLEDLKTEPKDFSGGLYVGYDFAIDLKKNDLSGLSCKNYLHIIQGKKDKVIDYKKNEEFFKKVTGGNFKMYYFEDADHRFKKPGELDKIVQIIKDIVL